MGLFGRKPPIVRVAFRDLVRPAPTDPNYGGAYLYSWQLKKTPAIGDRVVVPGMSGPAFAVVVGVGASRSELAGLVLKPVSRLVTADEMAAAFARQGADREAWLNMARKVAGLPTKGRVRKKTPEGFPDIPPSNGYVDAATAGRFGGVWWHLYKESRNEEEARAFSSIAHRWYAIRDRG